METKREWKAVLLMLGGFLAAYHLPLSSARFAGGVFEAMHLLRDYAREHVVACLLPAFLIAGGLAVFLKRDSVMRYLGHRARKSVAYAVASVSGSVLAVCSCTVLPLFAGIYRMGAGLGPASAFLYAGPAINILAIVLTANVLGWKLGVARAVAAVVFSVAIGLLMQLFHRRSEAERHDGADAFMAHGEGGIAHWKGAMLLLLLAGFLVSSNWIGPDGGECACGALGGERWEVPAAFALLAATLSVVWLGVRWQAALAASGLVVLTALMPGVGRTVVYGAGTLGFAAALAVSGGEARSWFDEAWSFARLILPLLLIGVLIAGALLGRPGHEGWVPSRWIETAVGGNSFRANLLAAVAGAFMYFATLTEIPIVQGLLGSGMGQGPALALLLAGPALSLPNMLVIRSVLGTGKTLTFVVLVVAMSTLTGTVFGVLA